MIDWLAMDLYNAPWTNRDYLKTYPEYLLGIYPSAASFAQFMRHEHRSDTVSYWYLQVANQPMVGNSDVLRLHEKDIRNGLIKSNTDRKIELCSDFTEFRLTEKGYKHFFKLYSFEKLFGDFKRNNPQLVRDYKVSKLGWFQWIFKYWIPSLSNRVQRYVFGPWWWMSD